MKVLLSAYACEPGRGSELGFGWNWAWALACAGHEVWVFTRSESRRPIEEFFERNPEMPNLHFIYVSVPAKVRTLLRGQLGVFAHYYLFQWQALRVARRLNEDVKLDLVHHVTWGSLHGGTWLWRLGKPLVFGPIGGGQVAPAEMKSYFGKDWPKEAVRTLATRLVGMIVPVRLAVSNASLVLATNQETAHVARQLGAKQVELFLDTSLAANFVPDEYPMRPAAPRLNVLWVGRLFPRKALRLALEALAEVPAELPVYLTVVGGGPQAPLVNDWINELGLMGRVDYRGQIPWGEVRQAYLDSDVFLFTSLRDSFGSQVLEAMAQGLPVIALNHQGVRDFVPNEASVKVAVENPVQVRRDLAQALVSLCVDPGRRLAMGRVAWQYAKEHTWDAAVTDVEKRYMQMVAQRVSSLGVFD